ncbi:riboflavin synthase [Hydrogenimonas cancrithermarum]|uniref:Riboflavin synthase n=1 Tax=Hydrogenimonas cancrithermarum TaxID=2993563 RepID=A0ABN6WUK0_9BACT|nr:riboflavin synthase [Hydrogenimonas cancrithermarum]BDY12790.1 riboflavin synthase subunit alpha [Hydrogenimonas cancrithermarum]
MFTGLIREMAEVVSYENNVLTLKASYRPNIGDSIAVNGACLTVVKLGEGTFSVELADETRKVIAMENLKGRVHIEPAMQMGERFEGHIVQGHVDTVGTVTRIQKRTNGTDFFITIPGEFLQYVIPKGSVTVDGVSLTVNEVTDDGFRLTIIPHTLKETLFGNYRIGTRVNVETDLFARYVANILEKRETAKRSGWDTIERIQALY